MSDWVVGSDVAGRLGVPDDQAAADAAAAACQLVRDRRSLTTDEDLAQSASVREGTLRWACVLRKSGTTATGFPQVEGAGDDGFYDTMADIYRMTGLDVVVA